MRHISILIQTEFYGKIKERVIVRIVMAFSAEGGCNMIYTLEELKEKIAPIAEKYQLPAVFIFGSYARNEATEDSDVDVLVDLSGSIVKGWVIGGLYNDLCDSLNKEIDLVTLSSVLSNYMKRDDPWFAHNLMNESVMLYER